MLVDLTRSASIPVWKDIPKKPIVFLLKARILSEEISSHIRNLQINEPSLFEGAGACALYFLTRYEATRDKNDLKTGLKFIEQVKTFLSGQVYKKDYSYCTGLAGVLYLLRYLSRKKLIQTHSGNQFMRHEHELFLQAAAMMEREDNDLMTGSFGILRYFISSSGHCDNKKYAKNLLHKVVSSLREHHSYFSVGNLSHPHESLYPGMNGGQCSFLLVLLEALEKGLLTEKNYEAIEKGIKYIMQFKEDTRPSNGRHFFLPQSVNILTRDKIYDSDPHYYLPDLNLALLLHRCAVAFDSSTYHQAAIALGSNTLMRLVAAPYYCPGAGFAKGAAGLAHFYNILYNCHPAPSYLHGHYMWIQNTLHFLENGWEDKNLQWDRASLQNGLCGTGLVLLSFINDDLRDWSRVVLL